MDDDLDILKRALIAADLDAGVGAAGRLIEAGADPRWVLEEGMAVAMFDLGEMWKRGEVFLPEVVASAEVFKACNAIVEPALLAQRTDADVSHVVVLCTVKGDLHDLGKNMVGAMMKTAGFEVIDLGKDTPTEKIVNAVKELEPQIVGLSALLTTTVPQQKVVIEALRAEGLLEKVRVMVGGAPVTQEWADEAGADGFAPDAPVAVRKALDLVAAEANA